MAEDDDGKEEDVTHYDLRSKKKGDWNIQESSRN